MISSPKQLGGETRLAQRALHRLDDRRAVELARRDVDRHADAGRDLLPARAVVRGALQHPFADRVDEAGLLGDADELVGRDQLHVGPLPAHERFEVGRAPGARTRRSAGSTTTSSSRSIARRSADSRSRRADTSVCMRWSKSSMRPRPRSLARYIAASAWRTSSSARSSPPFQTAMPIDAVSMTSSSPSDERRAQHLVEATGAVGDLVDVARLVAQHDELVAAEPGDRVALARAGAEPRGDLDEQGVAEVVAEAVVHVLEAVEVEQQHADDRAAALRRGGSPRRAGRSAACALASPVSSSYSPRCSSARAASFSLVTSRTIAVRQRPAVDRRRARSRSAPRTPRRRRGSSRSPSGHRSAPRRPPCAPTSRSRPTSGQQVGVAAADHVGATRAEDALRGLVELEDAARCRRS